MFLGAHERLLTCMVFENLQASQKWLIFVMFLFTHFQFFGAGRPYMPFWGGVQPGCQKSPVLPPPPSHLRNPGGLRSGLRCSLNGGRGVLLLGEMRQPDAKGEMRLLISPEIPGLSRGYTRVVTITITDNQQHCANTTPL